jgi:hypothetical protein
MYARSARKEAETLLEQRSRALYDANFELSTVAAQLEKIVEWRMAQLSEACSRLKWLPRPNRNSWR